MKYLMLCMTFFIGTAFADTTPPDMVTKVIAIQYLQADALAKQLKPLLGPGETITSSGSSLIVNVSPNTLTRIRPVIHQLDVPPVVFNISIHQGSNDWLNQGGGSSVTYSATSNSEAANNQSVSVMSGQSAFVATGSDRPVISGVSGGWVPGVSYEQKSETQGFYIAPVMQGSRVKITIHRVRDQANATDTQQSSNQAVDTTTMVPLDTWVKLGSPNQGNNDNNNAEAGDATTYTASNSYNNQAALYIKISVTPQ
ncbi:type II/III secretion system protein [Legionella sp. CNM-4043-24]|uniref:type II/III secretion system protein n=1 Tax=Legionella sp. CNM-4043-24 TaxID=3421646 RepID=UPI00403AD120